jgi:glycosyltransferase involved in cell wall biosynthesis
LKLLQLCLRVPYPPADGGAIAMFNLANAMHSSGASVDMLAINTAKHFTEVKSLPESVVNRFHPKAVFVDTDVKIIPAFTNLFSKGSYNISRFESDEFKLVLNETLATNRYDAVIVESLFMAPYLVTVREHTKAPVFLRAHNVEYIIWERLAKHCNNPFKKQYLKFLAARLKKYETEMINRFDGIIAISKQDEEWFRKLGCKVPIHIAPVSVETDSYSLSIVNSTKMIAFHLGSMDWMPNAEGVNWFLEEVYPLLPSDSGFSIVVAGKGMPQRIFDRARGNLEVLGKVDDARQFMAGKQIMLVPLLSGGGMRVKIIEGLAMGKTIITTSTGAEGIDYTDGLDILIADDPVKFATQIRNCINDPDWCLKIGEQARNLAVKYYDNKVIGKRVVEFLSNPAGPIIN